MITKAIILVDGEETVEITSQYLLGMLDASPDKEDIPVADGHEVDYVRSVLQECFQQIYPDNEIDVVFPEMEGV